MHLQKLNHYVTVVVHFPRTLISSFEKILRSFPSAEANHLAVGVVFRMFFGFCYSATDAPVIGTAGIFLKLYFDIE